MRNASLRARNIRQPMNSATMHNVATPAAASMPTRSDTGMDVHQLVEEEEDVDDVVVFPCTPPFPHFCSNMLIACDCELFKFTEMFLAKQLIVP